MGFIKILWIIIYISIFFIIKLFPYLLTIFILWMVLGDGSKIFTKKQRAKSIHLSKKWTLSITNLWMSMMFQFLTLILIMNLTEFSVGSLLYKAGFTEQNILHFGIAMAIFNFLLLIGFAILKVVRTRPHIYKNLKIAGTKYTIVHQTEKTYICFKKDEITIYKTKKYISHKESLKEIYHDEIRYIETFNITDITGLEINSAGKRSYGRTTMDIGWAVSMQFRKHHEEEMYKLFSFIKKNYTVDSHTDNALFWIQTQ